MTPRVPPLSYRKLGKVLAKHGFRPVRQVGSHTTWSDGDRRVTVPRHAGSLGPGLVKAILEQAGVDVDDQRR